MVHACNGNSRRAACGPSNKTSPMHTSVSTPRATKVTTNNPAEFTITKSTFKTLGHYAFVSILCLLILTWIMQLWRADFKVPFMYFVDSLFYNIATKGTIEHGWWLHNQSLGAPAG